MARIIYDRAMLPATYTVFISYSRRDQGVAQAFQKCVQVMGGKAYVAECDMAGGRDLRNELIKQMTAADEMLFLVSDAFLQSKWTGWELGAVEALNAGDKRGRLIVPVYCSVSREAVEDNRMWQAHFARLAPVEMHRVAEFLGELRDRINTKLGHQGHPDDLTAWLLDGLKELRSVMEEKFTAFETSFKAKHRKLP
jgi:TIR domain